MFSISTLYKLAAFLILSSTIKIAKAQSLPIWDCAIASSTFSCDQDIPLKTAIRLNSDIVSSDLSVLWWNIEFGITNNNIKKLWGKSPLLQNLRNLIETENSPDVLILGEIQSQFVSVNFPDFESTYPYYIYLPYSESKHMGGMMLFSKYPLSAFERFALYGYPQNLSADKVQEYKKRWNLIVRYASDFDRVAGKVLVRKGSQDYQLVFAHLINPWPAMMRMAEGDRFEMFLKMVFSPSEKDKTPLDYQIAHLDSIVRGLTDHPFILIGDFNAPLNAIPKRFRVGRVLGAQLFTSQFSSHAYDVLSEDLQDAFTSTLETMPTASSQLFTPKYSFKVDHAFLSRELVSRQAEVFPLAGSDHYPIFVRVGPQR